MNAIQNFAFEEKLVRVVEHEGASWFVGVDVCRALELAKPENALLSLDDDERYTLTEGVVSEGAGRSARIIVSEPGVYRLVFRSRKPEAERFKRWLAHEVLPQIRRTGRFEAEGAKIPPELDPAEREFRALRMVTEARLIYGKAAAARLWVELGLPMVPAPLPDGLPGQCLERLLSLEVAGGPVREALAAAFLGVDTAIAALLAVGIRVEEGFFVVANTHPTLIRLFRGTRFAPHYRLLRRMEGAEQAEVAKYGRNFVSRGVRLPAFYHEEEQLH